MTSYVTFPLCALSLGEGLSSKLTTNGMGGKRCSCHRERRPPAGIHSSCCLALSLNPCLVTGDLAAWEGLRCCLNAPHNPTPNVRRTLATPPTVARPRRNRHHCLIIPLGVCGGLTEHPNSTHIG
jgi:hypothetical protein